MHDRNVSWSANAFLVIIPMLNVLGGEKKRSEYLKMNFKKRTAEKCEIMFMSTAFPDTRTDRSPIPSKGGTFGTDRNVWLFHRATLGWCSSLSQAITDVSQIKKILLQLFRMA